MSGVQCAGAGWGSMEKLSCWYKPGMLSCHTVGQNQIHCLTSMYLLVIHSFVRIFAFQKLMYLTPNAHLFPPHHRCHSAKWYFNYWSVSFYLFSFHLIIKLTYPAVIFSISQHDVVLFHLTIDLWTADRHFLLILLTDKSSFLLSLLLALKGANKNDEK